MKTPKLVTLNSPEGWTFSLSAKVDYERRKRYRLLISAIDQHHHPLVSLAPIVVNVEDINDNRPVFDKILYEAEIGENIDGGTSLLRVNASDKDASLNGDVRYSIVEEEMNRLFRIDENSGEIFTLVTLDADVNSKYRFEVKAVDRGQPALSEVAVVEVRVIDENDNSPKFSRLFRAEIEENSPIGAFVTQVSSIDADVYSVVAYELEDNSTNTFQIDPHSGNVTLASYIDREKQSEYALKVRAMDGVWQVRTSLTISVLDQNDNAPSFIRQHFRFFVLSNTSVGCMIGRIRATDADSAENGVVFYSLECPQDRFTVDPITGSVSLSLPLGDYTNVTFSCEAIAVDGGLPSLKAMVVDIDVVDDGVVAPRFIDRHPYFAVLANSSEGTIIGELLTESPTYYVIFSVDDDRFAVDQNGTMLAKSNFTMFEVGSSITLSIQALFEEPSTLSDEINVTMETADVNRNAPKFTSKRITFSVPENSALLTAVGTVSAHDDDLGVNGRIIYTMETNETEKVPFSVNATSGTIFVIGSLDYEEKRMYRFFVVASDCGLPPQKATAQVMVNITDENDNVPQFEEDFIIVHVSF
ncbi:Cadherin-related tumor suppressor [Toxocara canis]|uniref:Cadherin-related tumor suppressor n=1 Tax=Toxocara canis TaxID=6265 RepID=A0A0B2VKX1_TOXCA|nr:Cadherin-related tumor suppressor [Toxocara canis]